MNSRILSIAMLAVCAATAACGGGGGSSTTPPISGITGVGVARGPITGVGSIFVNGVEYSTTSAVFRIEGQSGTQAQLKLGQIVTVQGRINDDGRTGRADTVTYERNVQGPILVIDLPANSFVVLGQTVRVTGSTSFDSGLSLAALAVGNTVEVSGFPNATGELVATHIERKAATAELEVTGVVASLDANARRFTLNALTVDYSAAQLVNGSPANGNCVEINGTTVVSNVLTATRVEVRSCTVAANDRDLGEIEGVITRFTSSADFELAGQRVVTGPQTQFVNGAAADLRANLRVEVEGTFDANLVLTARKVEIKPDTSARILGTVDAVNAANGTLTIFGITVQTSLSSTRFDDQSQARQSPFRIGDIRTSDYLEVRGFEGSAANSLIAVIVERRDLESRRELQGTARNVAQPNLQLIGVSVTTGGGTQYQDVTDAAITAAQFFAQAPNRLVKARGSWNGSAFTASELELENP